MSRKVNENRAYSVIVISSFVTVFHFFNFMMSHVEFHACLIIAETAFSVCTLFETQASPNVTFMDI